VFRKVLAGGLVLSLFALPNAVADSHQAFSHLHDVRVFGNEILLGTHEGLYKYIDRDSFKKIGEESHDVMGLSVFGKRIFASGHPAPGSSLPNPVGLLMSSDKGVTWKKISLQGKTDFHFLEVASNQIYGVDAGSGELMYSANLGKSWKNLGRNTFSDIAINPRVKGSALALRDGKLYTSNDLLKTIKEVKTGMTLTSIDWSKKSLLAAFGNSLMRSVDGGKTWSKVKTFAAAIGSISQSETLIVAIAGNTIQQSRDNGKTFIHK